MYPLNIQKFATQAWPAAGLEVFKIAAENTIKLGSHRARGVEYRLQEGLHDTSYLCYPSGLDMDSPTYYITKEFDCMALKAALSRLR